MSKRRLFGALLAGIVLAPLTSCNNSPGLTSIVISPDTPTVTLGANANGVLLPPGEEPATQYSAIGYYTRADHPAVTKDLTSEVTWQSNVPNMVTISSSGLVIPTDKVIGFCQITASMQGFNGFIVSNESTYTINLPTTTSNANMVSLAIAPSNLTATSLGQKTEYSATGTNGTGGTDKLTTNTAWSSSNSNVATVDPETGVVSTVAAGSAIITATYTNPSGLKTTAFTTLTVAP